MNVELNTDKARLTVGDTVQRWLERGQKGMYSDADGGQMTKGISSSEVFPRPSAVQAQLR